MGVFMSWGSAGVITDPTLDILDRLEGHLPESAGRDNELEGWEHGVASGVVNVLEDDFYCQLL